MMKKLLPILLLCLLPGCKGGDRKSQAAPVAATQKKVSNKGKESPLQSLLLPGRELAARLGAHRLEVTADLSSAVKGYPAHKVEQKVRIDVDGQGGWSARKETHKQLGQEVVFSDGWLYPRLRYSKFIRRKPRDGEPSKILDRMASHLPGYLELLDRHLELSEAGAAEYQGRPVSKVKLSLRDKPRAAAAAGAGPARRWRQVAAVTELEGEALIDVKTRVVLSAKLAAKVAFKAPRPSKQVSASGLPAVMSDKLRGEMEINYQCKVTRLGKVAPIKAPADDEVITDVRRRRLELERQLLAGEVEIPADWSKEP